jgi:hypothetical protein
MLEKDLMVSVEKLEWGSIGNTSLAFVITTKQIGHM